jgi:hypothetical protein
MLNIQTICSLTHYKLTPLNQLLDAVLGLSDIERWTELFGFFWTLSIVWYVKVLQKTTTFRRLDLSPTSGGWGRVDQSLVQWWKLALSDGPNWVGLPCPIHLRTEIDPVSETLWSLIKLPHTRRWTESKRSQIVLYNVHHRQTLFKSIERWMCQSLYVSQPTHQQLRQFHHLHLNSSVCLCNYLTISVHSGLFSEKLWKKEKWKCWY